MSIRKARQDNEGRTSVAIPAFLRDKYQIQAGDSLSFDCRDDEIIIKKVE